MTQKHTSQKARQNVPSSAQQNASADIPSENRTHSRRLRILEAVVRDYVATHEPVGSRSLVERYDLGVSPATVRNDMAALEDKGYLAQPHTSAGRIPTDAGYRSFVDSLDEIKPLSPAERRAIERFLDGAVDLDDAVIRAVRLLARITNHVALVQYPSLNRISLRHIELIKASDTHVILILITDAGRVEQRRLATREPHSEETLAQLTHSLNTRCAGKLLSDVPNELENLRATSPEPLHPLLNTISEAICEAVAAESEERVVLAGTANLSRNADDFSNSISPVLDLLEEQVVLLKLMAGLHDGLSVSIGQENNHAGLGEASLVAASYDIDGSSVARLGVVGPTRMDYPGTMAAVYAISRYLSHILTGK